MSISDLERERQAVGLTANGDSLGRSLAERAGDVPAPSEPEEEFEEELFVLEQGRRVTVSQLVQRGTPVEYAMNLNSKSIRGGGDMGLLSYSDPNIILIVPARQGKVVHDPTYDDDGMVVKVTVRVNFKPQTVHDVSSPEGRALLGLD